MTELVRGRGVSNRLALYSAFPAALTAARSSAASPASASPARRPNMGARRLTEDPQ